MPCPFAGMVASTKMVSSSGDVKKPYVALSCRFTRENNDFRDDNGRTGFRLARDVGDDSGVDVPN